MRLRFRRQLLAVVGLVAALLGVAGYETDALRRLELLTVDTRFEVRGERPVDGLVTVNIDQRTLDAEFPDPATGERKRIRYPFPRSFDARVIDRLRRDDARVIAYDVQFVEPTVGEEDTALLDAAYRARPVVFAASKVDEQGRTNVFGGVEAQGSVGARVGSVNFPPDPGGVLRRVPFQIEGLKSFAVVSAETADRRRLTTEDIGGERVLIDYAGPPGTIPSRSYVDVFRGKFRRGTFKDKIVVVGASDPVLHDAHATSTSGDGLMPGPEIQANAIATVRRGGPLREAGSAVALPLIALLGLIVPLLSYRMSPLHAQGVTLVAGAAYVVGAQLAFNDGRVVPVVYPLGALAVGSFGAVAIHYLLAAFDRQRAHETFARFVPEPVVDRLLAITGDDMRLGGSRVTATVMFSDIRGFTTFSETRDPEEVIDVLNRYFDEMTGAILDHGGTLVNYIGDGIMAIWGAPLEQSDHADRALAAAREMLEVRLARVNEWLRSAGGGHQFRIGIGLHSGPLVAGNVGSLRRLQYTAIGDTCNAASRIEGLTKDAGYPLLVSEATYALLAGDQDGLVFVDEAAIRGRVSRIRLYGLGAN